MGYVSDMARWLGLALPVADNRPDKFCFHCLVKRWFWPPTTKPVMDGF
jgi:hypothetical protein